MNIVLIGSGNVATILGTRLKGTGHEILQVLSPRNAQHLAEQLGASAIQELQDIRRDAELYLIATPDKVIPELRKNLRVHPAVVVHTAGAVPLGALDGISTRYGVLYPLQSMRKETEPSVIPLLVDGSDEHVRSLLEDVARSISPMVRHCGDEERLFFHIGAVFVNNFPNYLYTITDQYLKERQLSFDLLLPLMQETVHRLDRFPPADMQTGPAIRGDEGTLDLHRHLLAGEPEMLAWYNAFTEKIRARS